jgi:hypothetical protein
MRIRFLALLVVVSMTACGIGKQGSPREFPMLNQVTSVNVVGHDGSKPSVKVTDRLKVSQIVAFIDSHRTGWIKPWYGNPVPTVTAEMFDGTEFKGSFGVGNDFFETQRAGSFFSQRASSVEVRHFLDLLGVDEEGTRYFKEDHLTGADYLALRPDGSYTLKDREHVGLFAAESGRWNSSGTVLTFEPDKPGKVPYRGEEVAYRGHTFLSWQNEENPTVAISVEDIKKHLDANAESLPSYVFFQIDATAYQQETAQTYPFHTISSR